MNASAARDPDSRPGLGADRVDHARRSGFFYLLLGLIAIVVIGFGVVVPASRFIENWARRDVESQTNLAFHTISDRIAVSDLVKNGGDLTPLLDRIAGGNRDIALGYCAVTATCATPPAICRRG